MRRFAITLSIVATAAFFVLGARAFAQSGELRTVPLVVMNPEGKLVDGLTAENLRVKGAGARVQNAELDTGPRHIILLLDISGSMKSWNAYGAGSEKWQYAKEMVKAFLDCTSPRDFLALDVFAKTGTQSVPFTHDFASIRTAIDALPEPGSKQTLNAWGDKTWAGDALHAALFEIGDEPEFGDAVIFFSDGEFSEDDHHHSLEWLRAELARRGIRVFLALPFASQMQTPLPLDSNVTSTTFYIGISDPLIFMENTGGFSFAPAIPESPQHFPLLEVYRSDPVQKRVKALYDAVQETYRVELQLNTPLHKKHGLQFEVIDRRGKVSHDLLLLYPRDLYAN